MDKTEQRKAYMNRDFLKDSLDRNNLCEIILHAVDISNPAKKYDIFSSWTDKINIEFSNQGKEEEKLNLPISLGCDEQKFKEDPGSSEKFTLNFISFLVYPL